MRTRQFFLILGLASIVMGAGLYLYFRARPSANPLPSAQTTSAPPVANPNLMTFDDQPTGAFTKTAYQTKGVEFTSNNTVESQAQLASFYQQYASPTCVHYTVPSAPNVLMSVATPPVMGFGGISGGEIDFEFTNQRVSNQISLTVFPLLRADGGIAMTGYDASGAVVATQKISSPNPCTNYSLGLAASGGIHQVKIIGAHVPGQVDTPNPQVGIDSVSFIAPYVPTASPTPTPTTTSPTPTPTGTTPTPTTTSPTPTSSPTTTSPTPTPTPTKTSPTPIATQTTTPTATPTATATATSLPSPSSSSMATPTVTATATPAPSSTATPTSVPKTGTTAAQTSPPSVVVQNTPSPPAGTLDKNVYAPGDTVVIALRGVVLDTAVQVYFDTTKVRSYTADRTNFNLNVIVPGAATDGAHTITLKSASWNADLSFPLTVRAKTVPATPAATAAASSGGTNLWLWIGIGAGGLILIILILLWLRRRVGQDEQQLPPPTSPGGTLESFVPPAASESPGTEPAGSVVTPSPPSPKIIPVTTEPSQPTALPPPPPTSPVIPTPLFPPPPTSAPTMPVPPIATPPPPVPTPAPVAPPPLASVPPVLPPVPAAPAVTPSEPAPPPLPPAGPIPPAAPAIPPAAAPAAGQTNPPPPPVELDI